MFYSTGKRKTSIARVRVFDKTEKKKAASGFTVNGKDVADYFKEARFIDKSKRPLKWSRVFLQHRIEGNTVDKQFSTAISSIPFSESELDHLNALSAEEASALLAAVTDGSLCIVADVKGGGSSSQADAVMYGLAKILIQMDDKFRKMIRAFGLASRDPRIVERKKPGLRKARKKEQYSKR